MGLLTPPTDPPVKVASPFDPKGTGPGYTESNTPVAPVAPVLFSLPNPYRTDLPATLNAQEFATASTASIMAVILGGTARLESDPNLGGMEPIWMVDFPSASGRLQITWNAALLYRYYQMHPDYKIPSL